jgi:DNA helicase HerA-like ATPase
MIRKKSINYPEIRVVLLGDTGSGKTTFLSNILLNKIDDDLIEPRIYLMNHKHEIETKKTSSINYNYKVFNNIKYVFIEAPGDFKYSKTKYKILLK